MPALTHNPELPVRLQEVIDNCLEKDRELRYQSAADLRADLKRVRRDIEVTHSARLAAGNLDASSSSLYRGTSRSGSRASSVQDGSAPSALPVPQRRFMPATAVAVVLFALGALALYRFWPVPASAPVTTSPQVATSPPAATSPSDVSASAATAQANVADRLQLARANLDAKNYRAAGGYAAEILAIAPGHAEATKIRERAEEMLSQFDSAIADARNRISAGDIEGAARALDRARVLDPGAPSVIEIASRLSTELRRRESAARVEPRAPRTTAPVVEPKPAAPPPPPPPPPPQQARPVPPAAVVSPPVQAAPPPPAAPEPAPKPAAPLPPTEPPAVEKRPADVPRAPAQNDDASIRQLVATYARAIEEKDIALFRTIKPNLSREEERRLQESFRAVTSQRVNLTIASIDRTGDTASVVVNRTDIIQAGGRQYTTNSRQALRLARTGAGWAIVEIR